MQVFSNFFCRRMKFFLGGGVGGVEEFYTRYKNKINKYRVCCTRIF